MNTHRIDKLARLLLVFVLAVFLAIGAFPRDAEACPPGMSDLDCGAINGGWPDWVPDSCDQGDTSTPTSSDNEQKTFNYFSSKGLNSTAAAAVVGNLMEESGINPIAIQNPPGGTTHDPSWIDAKNNNNPQLNPQKVDLSQVGWGIAQWTPGDKAITVQKSLKLTGAIDDLATQLDMVWGQMTGTSPVNKQNMVVGLEQQTNLKDAVEYFRANFEGGDANPARLSDAQTALQLYGSTTCAAQCNNGTDTTLASLSSTRQNVVCIAQQELAAWKQYIKSSPPYLQFEKYSDNNVGDQWCGDFVSWVYKQAGDPFTGGESGGWRIPLVKNIYLLGLKKQQFFWHPLSEGYTPRAGDIAIYWTADPPPSHPDNPYYHTAIVESVTVSQSKSGRIITVKTIGGDQDAKSDSTFGGPQSTSVVDEWSTHKLSDFGAGGGFVSPDN